MTPIISIFSSIQVTGKGGHQRRLPLNATVSKALLNYKNARGPLSPDSAFFRSRNKRGISRNAIYERVRTHARKAHIHKRVSPHKLRHTFATHLVKRGVPLVTIRDMLGHRTITSTQIYLHVTADDLRDAADRHPIKQLAPIVKDILPFSRLPFQESDYRPEDILLVPFSLFWCYFLLLRLVSINEAPWFSIFIAIPLIFIGLYCLAGRYWLDICHRKSSYYGITNKRIILVSGLFRYSFNSFNHCETLEIQLKENRNGCGAILFGQPRFFYTLFETPFFPVLTIWGFDRYAYRCFDLIDNARDVYELLTKVRQEKQSK